MIDDRSAGCYVHLPFCDRICPYCDFAVVTYANDRMKRYLGALEREIALAERPSHPVRTIYFGGGTPSTLEPDQLARLLDVMRTRHDIDRDFVECSLEANPSRSGNDLDAWRRAGITRLSIGVQSFDDGELHRLGRDHSADQAAGFVDRAKRAGFASVSIDLIAGVPGQDVASFARTLRRAIELDPDHISVYGLTIEAGTPYALWHAREPDAFPDDDALARMLVEADETLAAAGYEHYEISNFAKPGHRCEHNVGYWRQRDCVAYGMSAAGYEDGMRYRNERDFDAYCRLVESGSLARVEVERLDFARRIGEAAMLALRMASGIEDDDFRRRFGINASIAFAEAEKRCSAAGLLETDERGARLTARGRLFANDVCADFLTPQLERPLSASAKGATTS